VCIFSLYRGYIFSLYRAGAGYIFIVELPRVLPYGDNFFAKEIGGAPTAGSARASPISLENIIPRPWPYGKTLGDLTIVCTGAGVHF
jgi:hypothetical protein